MPSDTTIREQVDTITRSGAMGSEDTALVKIFHYLVEEELAGRGHGHPDGYLPPQKGRADLRQGRGRRQACH